MSFDYDLTIIGSGPGGYVAAEKAASFGLRTALIEKDDLLGGTCLHRGCIPTKALLHAADLFLSFKDASRFGIFGDNICIKWTDAQKNKEKIVKKHASGISALLLSKKVDIINGFGKIINSKEVFVLSKSGRSRKIKTKNIIISTGAKPKELTNMSVNSNRVLNSDGILSLEKIPSSLVILGGGAIGIEFASLFSSIGSKVSILEYMPEILSNADLSCSRTVVDQLKKKNVSIFNNSRILNFLEKQDHIDVEFSHSGSNSVKISGEYVLVAIGRTPATSDMGLSNINVEINNGFIRVNDAMKTNEDGVYAIGDCVNTPLLAHVASAEAVLAVEDIVGKKPVPINYKNVPYCVYSEPSVAWCGITEEQARSSGVKFNVGVFDFSHSGKASIFGKNYGFVKIITDTRYGEIFGCHVVGNLATELLAELALAMQLEATVDDLAYTVHAHPTLYEAIGEAAKSAISKR